MDKTIQDKWLICKDCHRKFVFTVAEQKNFGQKGYPDPVRCKYCQRQKKILNLALKDGVNMADEVRFSEACDKCNRSFYTKIKRRTGINLYCDDCWNEIKRAKPDEENRKENKGVVGSQAEVNTNLPSGGDNKV